MTLPRWGLVATIKADADTILNWAAHHLDLGADHLHIFLDEPNAEAEAALSNRPDITVIVTDAAYWRMRRPRETHQRPPRHQGRQFANAKWAYMHTDLDWLGHIDVDEFLWPDGAPVAEQLAALTDTALCARIRPVEALAPEGPGQTAVHFKSCAEKWVQRLEETRDIYPTYGEQLNGGFLSHVAGKMFVRCGLSGVKLHIHNVDIENSQNPGEAKLPEMALLHLHADNWERWKAHFDYRMAKGSYRKELAPPTQPAGAPKLNDVAVNLNTLFAMLAEDPAELRHFFDEVCTATPRLLGKLREYGHLRSYSFDPATSRQRIFER